MGVIYNAAIKIGKACRPKWYRFTPQPTTTPSLSVTPSQTPLPPNATYPSSTPISTPSISQSPPTTPSASRDTTPIPSNTPLPTPSTSGYPSTTPTASIPASNSSGKRKRSSKKSFGKELAFREESGDSSKQSRKWRRKCC